MEKDFEKKVKQKKIRNVVIGLVVIVAAVVALWQFDIIGAGGSGSKNLAEGDGETITVSMEVKCDTVAKDTKVLKDQSKAEYVPKDGVVLKETEYKIEKGANAYDLFSRGVKAEDIHMEAEFSKSFGSHFVKGINHLYMGDAGDMSGWMFYMNKEMPEYGLDGIELKDGDKLLLVYSVTGGSDIELK